MIPIVGVSLEEALLGFGGNDDAELHDKEVALTTSDVTGSQTAIFEYDPQNEPVTGTPAGPWDGYSLFTIDLSGVKEDIEGYLAQISALEDEVEGLEDEVEELEDELEQCHDCKDATVAAMQAIDPDYVIPASGCIDDIPDKAYQKGRDDEAEENPPGYEFPKDDPDNPDPDRYDKIAELVGGDPLTDNDLHIIVKPMDDRYPITPQGQHNVYYGFYDSVTGTFIGRTSAYQGGLDLEHTDYVSNFHITDPSTGAYTFDWVNWEYLYNPPEWGWVTHTYTETDRNLIGYGDPTHSYTVTNRKNS